MRALEPQIVNSVSFDELLNAYASARDALRAGDYESALAMAARDGDAMLLAVARIMCGAVAYGLAGLPRLQDLEDELKLYAAYGCWCCDDVDGALALLRGIAAEPQAARARRLESVIGKPRLQALVFAYSNFLSDIADCPSGQLTYSRIAADVHVSSEAFEQSLAEALPADVAIVYGTPPDHLVERILALGMPVVAYAFDTDIYLHFHFDLLRRADAIVCSGAHEFRNCRAIHGGRIASFPGFDLYRDSASVDLDRGTRDIDVFFSGNLLAPHMAEKSRLAFQLAAIDDPSLTIQIIDGKLPEADYRALLRRSKLSPIAFRMSGPLQTRGIDTIRYGADVLHIGDLPAKYLFRAAADAFHPIAREGLAGDIRRYVADFTRGLDARAAVASDLLDVLWPSPRRDVRMAKFALFHLAVQLPTPKKTRSGPSELDLACAEATAAFGQFCEAPLDKARRDAATHAYAAARTAHPRSLVLAFNQGCYEWMAGERAAAVSSFHAALDLARDGDFEPGRQSLVSYRLLLAREFMPYQIFWESIIADLAHNHGHLPTARAVIAASARTYLALDRLQAGDSDAGTALLEQALVECPRHFPAWRLYAKSLAAAGTAPDRVCDALYHALNLYPPYLTQLLPIGAFYERARGHDAAAMRLVTQWAWFFARTQSHDMDPRRVPSETFDEVRRYWASFGEALRAALRRRAPETFGI